MALQLVPPRRVPFGEILRWRFDNLLKYGDPETYDHRRGELYGGITDGGVLGILDQRGVDLNAVAHVLKAACMLKAMSRMAADDRAWYRELDKQRESARQQLRKAYRLAGMSGVEDIIRRDPVLNPDWYVRTGDLNADYRASGLPDDPHFDPSRLVLRRSGPRRLPCGNPMLGVLRYVRAELTRLGVSGTADAKESSEQRRLLFAVGLAKDIINKDKTPKRTARPAVARK